MAELNQIKKEDSESSFNTDSDLEYQNGTDIKALKTKIKNVIRKGTMSSDEKPKPQTTKKLVTFLQKKGNFLTNDNFRQ